MPDISFNERLMQLARKHEQLVFTSSYAYVEYALGARPSWRSQVRSGFPWRVLAFLLALAWVFQACVIIHMGESNYWRHVLHLEQGNLAERIAGWLIYPKLGALELAHLLAVIFP